MIERLRVRIPAEAAAEFSSPGLTFCADSYSVSVLPRVTAVARKKTGHSAKSAGGRLHLNTRAPLTRHNCCPGTAWEPVRKSKLTRNSSGNTQPQSSQLAVPLWTDPGPSKTRGTGERELIYTLTTNK